MLCVVSCFFVDYCCALLFGVLCVVCCMLYVVIVGCSLCVVCRCMVLR